MLFEMMTGEKPTGTEVPSDLKAGIAPNIDEAFRRAYARLDRRFASAGEFLATLGGSTTLVPPPLAPTRVERGARPTNEIATCARCSRTVGAKDQFCMHCGVQLVRTVKRCGHCGAYPDADDEYCNQCGKTLSKMRLAN
jgi:predicted amidophosphoribosyltransferase